MTDQRNNSDDMFVEQIADDEWFAPSPLRPILSLSTTTLHTHCNTISRAVHSSDSDLTEISENKAQSTGQSNTNMFKKDPKSRHEDNHQPAVPAKGKGKHVQ